MIKNDRDMLARLIGFFLILVFIFLVAHFCMSPARGQSPPMNPVTYNWAVDPLGIYINTLDTYRLLQQHAAEIDTLDSEADTLELEVDTLRLWADTLKLEVDTLRLRVDSIQASRDTICFIYDAAGGQEISALSGAYILIDTEVFEDGIFTHAVDACSVGVNTAGRFEVSYAAAFSVTTPTDPGSVLCKLRKYSGSWSDVPGGKTICTWETGTEAYFTVSKTVACTLSVGDAVALHAGNWAQTTTVTTIDNTVSLSLKKLH